VSLSILGLIAALTLPSIFNSVKTSKDKAVIKEGFNAIQIAGYEGKMKGEIYSLPTYINYLRKNLNATHICEAGTDDPTKPCNINNRSDRTSKFRVTLVSGFTIMIYTDWALGGNLASVSLYIDGNKAPAPAGGDGWLAYNYTDATVTNTDFGTTTVRSGETAAVGAYASEFYANYGL